ncbi:MAG TPA: efflux RND transporter periplasmic adaptor subunit [Pyrinomonadaceae bacterium]|nr:efflux RND transporter periplasmic adaptor subunit [Pyrinomonadaceae bacterium]
MVRSRPQIKRVDEEEPEPDQPDAEVARRPFYKRRGVIIAVAVVLLLGAIFGVRYWLYSRSHESTDDAFIDGHIIQVSPKASGYVAKIYVNDNQQVKAGDLIVELDARDYEVRLQQAKAALDAGLAKENEAKTNVTLTRATTSATVQQARATVQKSRSDVASSRAGAASLRSRASEATSAVSTAQANLAQTQAQVVAAQADVTRANADVERYRELYAKDEISQQRLVQAETTANTAAAQLEVARQRVTAAEARVNEARAAQNAAAQTAQQAQTQIGSAQASVNEALGRLAQANAAPQQVAVSQAQAETAGATTEQLRSQVAQAELELSYTKIYAPEDGRVTRKSVEEGALVQIGQPLLAIVPGDVWVTANFKENQIGRMTPGQSVEISVDAYPDKKFRGHVDSIQAGTGARFSLIPPENATGNYVKVVQRVPVKIVFDEPPDPKHMLAPGMSVVPEVAVK